MTLPESELTSKDRLTRDWLRVPLKRVLGPIVSELEWNGIELNV